MCSRLLLASTLRETWSWLALPWAQGLTSHNSFYWIAMYVYSLITPTS